MKKIFLIIFIINIYVFNASALQTGQSVAKLKIAKWLKNGPVVIKTGRNVTKENRNDLYVLVLWEHGPRPVVNLFPCWFICRINTAIKG